jgi:uncharacterized protein YkwD
MSNNKNLKTTIPAVSKKIITSKEHHPEKLVNKIQIPLLLIVLLTVLLPGSSATAETTYVTYLPLVYSQGTHWVNPQNRSESLAFYKTNYLIENPPAINWNGSHTNCTPGTTSSAFKEAILQRINYFRAMAGVPAEVTFSHESNLKAQAAALLMSVNCELNHDPPKTWTCYSSLAHEGARSSNLYLGINGWDAITGYMKDPGDGNEFVGHRRWILYPQTQIMGTGDIPPVTGYRPSNALLVFDEHMWEPRPETRDGFVAWPPPGYVPYPVVFTRWSFSYPGADFSATKVTMTQAGNPVVINQAPVYNGFGENTIVWQIQGMSCGQNWPRPSQDTRYTINLKNVSIDGKPQDFSYDVFIFDPHN